MAKFELSENFADGQFLTTDVLRNVLARVDGATMARASCVSAQFRCLGDEEPFWENLCNQRWPSTSEPSVRSLVSSVGGFRKLYNNCFPFIACSSAPNRLSDDDDDDDTAIAAASDFVSIIDVTYNDEPVLSRVVNGVPGATAMCGPLVDILGDGGHGESTQKDDDGSGDTERDTERDTETPLSSLEVRLSWILINRKTQQAVNFASWKPLRGSRDDVVLRFGSIIPGISSSAAPIYCNIAMRCKTSTTSENSLKVTELGMHLEDLRGVHLRGSQAINALSHAMSTRDKTVAEGEVVDGHYSFMAARLSNQERLMRREHHRQTAGAFFLVAVFVAMMSIFI